MLYVHIYIYIYIWPGPVAAWLPSCLLQCMNV